MDFMKVFDQTVRDIKREINLRVLNVPEIEQKVLDATNDEPWGPHGSALSEIAEASKKYVDCEMVMKVIWQRLGDKNSNWRHLYKALAVIEYLIANGSERTIADIYDNISQISALERYEHVEPNLKDVGLNVRRKAEIILSILDDREKLQQVREKAASTRDKYIGLSSNGMGYKSSKNSYNGDKYKFSDSYHDDLSRETLRDNNKDISSYKNRKNNEEMTKNESRVVEKLKDDYDDDFDPRASSKSGDASPKKVDLLAPNLMDDLINIPKTETDLFSDANFQSASSNSETKIQSKMEDLFANKPSEMFDPFASVPFNNFDQTSQNESEFGSFNSVNESLKEPEIKRDNLQVKSGIWADSLSRGLIDLNITTPKKISLADQKGKSFKA
ncbi:hypothetical protein LUZ60_008362 [Juncus effusus]|nr:hypothetical protein LUZ60_008362 [Juncus effusus]